jgi:hypothetical protein
MMVREKYETKSHIVCARPSGSKRKRRTKIKITKKQVVIGSV